MLQQCYICPFRTLLQVEDTIHFSLLLDLTREFLKTLFLTFCSIPTYREKHIVQYIVHILCIMHIIRVRGLARSLFMRIYYYYFFFALCLNEQFNSHTLVVVVGWCAGRGRQIVDRKLRYTRIIITRTHIILLSLFVCVCVWSAFSCVLFAKPFSRAPVLARKSEQMCHRTLHLLQLMLSLRHLAISSGRKQHLIPAKSISMRGEIE